jgi:hypothetical protein
LEKKYPIALYLVVVVVVVLSLIKVVSYSPGHLRKVNLQTPPFRFQIAAISCFHLARKIVNTGLSLYVGCKCK